MDDGTDGQGTDDDDGTDDGTDGQRTDDDDDGTNDGTTTTEKCQNTFKVCSHIQKNRQYPNPVFKIIIYKTKYTQNAKTHFKFSKMLENENARFFILLLV